MCLVVISISASCSFIVHYVWGVSQTRYDLLGVGLGLGWGNNVSYHGKIGEKVLPFPTESGNGGHLSLSVY